MARKVERVPRVTSRAGRINATGKQDGFTLLEVVCVLVIIAILAAIALPAIPFGTSRPRLEGYALEAAALLKADRNAAMRQHKEIATIVDAPFRTIRSGASARVVRFPSDVSLEATLASRCNQGRAAGTIRHFASGMSCGGVIALSRGDATYQVRINWLTGGVEVVSVN
jgi:general secretion pathway protein H